MTMKVKEQLHSDRTDDNTLNLCADRTDDITISLYGTADDSIVDGPGIRFTVFTQGCVHRCPGCHNPAAQPFEGGTPSSVDELWAQIEANPLLTGITLSGGEPFYQAAALVELARRARAKGLTVWAYSGYLYEDLLAGIPSGAAVHLLEQVDVLVDGPFIEGLKSLDLHWRGSSNQRLIDVAESLKTGQVVEFVLGQAPTTETPASTSGFDPGKVAVSDPAPVAAPVVAAIPAVAFVGKQNSGKTVLLEKLITALTDKAIRVATIKHHSHAGFEFDIKGKDSWRHRQAGSLQSVIVAPDQIASVRHLSHEVEVKQVIEAMLFESSVFGEMPQIILVEGYRHGGLPTIELMRADNPHDARRDLGVEDNEIIAVVTDMPRIVAQAERFGLPAFGFEDIEALACFLSETYLY